VSRHAIRVRAALAGLALLIGAGALVALVRADSGPAGAGAARSASAPSPPCTPAKLNVSALLADSQVTVSPGPGTRDASATTQISMLGVPASALSHLSVKGAHSGTHSGRLLAYSQGDGASFVPSEQFAEGELVSVRGDLTSAGRTSPFSWSFTVAVRDRAGAAGGSGRPAPHPAYYQSFRSRTDLQPPTVTVTSHVAGTSPGDLFIAPYSGPGQYGPMILDESGSMVWFKPLSPPGTRAADFRVQQYEGKPVLTWWQDPLIANGGRKAGEVILDSSYRQLAIVRAGNGYQPDLHEFQITPQGTGLITIYNGIDCDLARAGGARKAAVADTLLQEIDLKTGLVRFEWHSLDHVALGDSYVSDAHSSEKTPFDYFHINSIDVGTDGDLLVDARNTWAAYDIDRRTGQVRWRLGGKHSSYKLGKGTRTAFQHDARRRPDGTITFFDNGATPAVHPQSRAITVSLDEQRHTATLVREDDHPGKPLVAGSQGNAQTLPTGGLLVGWGEVPYISEFSAGGELLFDAHLPAPYESYRAYRLAWSGHPTDSPALATLAPSSAARVATAYVSWNGATDVSSWRVLRGSSPASLTAATTVPRTGFETTLSLPGARAGSYVQAQALDASGTVIGVSPAKKL
jgi:hypothetical protein